MTMCLERMHRRTLFVSFYVRRVEEWERKGMMQAGYGI